MRRLLGLRSFGESGSKSGTAIKSFPRGGGGEGHRLTVPVSTRRPRWSISTSKRSLSCLTCSRVERASVPSSLDDWISAKMARSCVSMAAYCASRGLARAQVAWDAVSVQTVRYTHPPPTNQGTGNDWGRRTSAVQTCTLLIAAVRPWAAGSAASVSQRHARAPT